MNYIITATHDNDNNNGIIMRASAVTTNPGEPEKQAKVEPDPTQQRERQVKRGAEREKSF